MSIAPLPDFLIIDDDPVNNMICARMIRSTISGASLKAFIDPQKGLDYIQSAYSNGNCNNAVLFVDINMRTLTGWEVLDIVNDFPAVVKDQVKIYMLSFSVDPQDQDRAKNYPLLTGYLPKPLSPTVLQTLFPDFIKTK